MRSRLWVSLTTSWFCLAGACEAADTLTIAPPAPWVLPIAPAADDGKAGEAPARILLRDEQADLQPAGIGRYFENVVRIDTPQGLSAGAVTIAWNPDTQSATVHKLQVRRGGQVIDVLASQKFTVIRRETNLENAVLDGVLTASIQPEGLQVGDIVDFAATVTTRDPAVGRHVEGVGAGWNGIPMARAHFRAQWPASVLLRIKGNGGLAVPKPVRRGGLASIEMAQDDVQPLALPKGAPLRFQYGRLVEMSDFASWGDLVALMLPLYVKAEALPAASPLQAEIARIKAASADPKARAEAALALVQDRVRYVFLGMNDGGLVPADADTTWARRFGDCKGKTALLLALLHALGIDAQPVLVSSTLGDGLDARLPEIGLFDHILVRAAIGGRPYWLDGTRVGDTLLDGIETPNFRWGLPLAPGVSALVPIVPPPLTHPQTDVSIRIDATAGLSLPAPVHIERVVRGDEAVADNLALNSLAPEVRDRTLRDFWKQRYDFADAKTVTSRFDAKARTMTFILDGTTRMDWNDGWYEADHVWIGYKPDFTRDPRADATAPYAVGFPSYTHVVETIELPPGSAGYTISNGADVDETVAGVEYHRHATLTGTTFRVEQSDRAIAPEFPASAAAEAEARLRALSKKSVFLNRPRTYVPTAAENTALIGSTPTTAAGLVDQGNALLNRGSLDEAIAAFTKALAIEPRNAAALADRAIAHAWKREAGAAKADLDAAEAISPREPVIFRARGILAEQAGHAEEAIAAYTRSLELDPANGFALSRRAFVEQSMGNTKAALADSAAALAVQPAAIDLYLLRANLLFRANDRDGAAREAQAMVAHAIDKTYAQVGAARIYDRIGRPDEAKKAFEAALADKPQAYVYINRAEIRPKSDIAGRRADIDAALRLDPRFMPAIVGKAALLADQRDWASAVATLTAALDVGKAPGLLNLRGIAYAKLHDSQRAEADFSAAHAAAKSAMDLNNICYDKATADVALDRALAECDAAVAQAPGAATIRDSRAFVLLRLHRTNEAIAEYDRALAISPALAPSLFGRALAEAEKGDPVAADRDAAAAEAAEPHLRETFAGYGLSLGRPSGSPSSVKR